MTPENYEIALLANISWRLAKSSDTNELIAIACTLRNHAIPRMGMGRGRTYTEVIEDFISTYPLRENPTINELSFSGPNGLLSVIDDIYNCKYIDITASKSQPGGAKYFARAATLTSDDWRYEEVIQRPGLHPIIGTFGAQQFYA